MGIKLSRGSGQMGPAGRPQPALFIFKKKKERKSACSLRLWQRWEVRVGGGVLGQEAQMFPKPEDPSPPAW